MTLETIASEKGVNIDSLKKKLRRNGMDVPAPGESLPDEVAKILLGDKRKPGQAPASHKKQPTPPEMGSPRQNAPKCPETPASLKIDWKKALPVLPLPMLGLAASWGVFHFSVHFVPTPVAIAESMGFELVYIGLAFTKSIREDLRANVLKVSLSAVAVSVIYNSISAALYAKTGGNMERSIEIVQAVHPVLFWLLAILHGMPLAVLGFFVADLQLNKKKND